MTRKSKILRLSVLAAGIILCIVITVLFVIPLADTLSSEEGRESVRDRVEELGITAYIIFFLAQMGHVILAFIPGEPFEILGGILFGGFWGLVLCEAGIFAAGAVVYFLVKRFGRPLVDAFVPREKFERFRFLHDEKKLELIVFIVFLIPGTPKDLLTYITALTDIKPMRFFTLSTLARIPSVVTSTMLGASISHGNWKMSVVIFLITAALGISGIFFNNYIENKNKKADENRKIRLSEKLRKRG
ncbi:MAG: TVP38/TMEM64 family protein [Porcipelethomonas sp.]